MKPFYKLLGLVLLASPVQADNITTIQLLNRPAAEIIPIVKPMLKADDVISGQGFKLFLRSSPETLEQVKEMIEMLDSAAKVLQISVFQGSDRDLRTLGISGTIQIENDDASIGIGVKTNKNSDGINYSTQNSSGAIKTTSTRARLKDKPIHRLRVTEGAEGYIETGEQIPYFSGGNWIVPGAAAGGIAYRDVTTGFYVLPRIHGDNVTLRVSPFKNSQSKTRDGNIETRHIDTTISGRVGEWMLIGSTTEQSGRSQNSTGSYASTRRNANESIWIKADLVQ